jgi:predicted membrane channel-forming protein YqfA (hemolysin III family)
LKDAWKLLVMFNMCWVRNSKMEKKRELMELKILIPILLLVATIFLNSVMLSPNVPEWLKAITFILICLSILMPIYRLLYICRW